MIISMTANHLNGRWLRAHDHEVCDACERRGYRLRLSAHTYVNVRKLRSRRHVRAPAGRASGGGSAHRRTTASGGAEAFAYTLSPTPGPVAVGPVDQEERCY